MIYLVFNEGYSASSGAAVTRAELSQEAIRVGRLLVELLPKPEAMGLLALMLIQESRRAARTTPEGELVLLEDQDRGLWDKALIAEGVALPEHQEQAAIANVLSDMDAEIAALGARREKTRAIKRGMMQQLLTGRARLV